MLAFVDFDQPSVVFGLFLAERQKLLKHNCDLLAIRCSQRIELKRVAADRKLVIVGGPGDWAVDVCELAPAGFTHAHTFGGVYSDELLISYRSGSQG